MRRFILPLGLAVVTLSIPAQSSGQSTSTQSQSSQSTTQSKSSSTYHSQSTDKSQSTNPKVNMSRAAGQMLDQTDQARKAVSNKDKQAALQHVDRAMSDIDRIQTASSGRKMVPIYTELEEVSILGPVQAAKRQAGSTSSGTQSAQSSTQGEQTRARTGTSTVQSVAGEYTTVMVDVNAARDHLQAARAALNSGDFTGADKALMAVQNGVVMETVAADMPLLRARENLALAKSRAQQGNYTESRSALRAASDSLKNYAQGNSPHATDANTLRQQIDSYAQNIDTSHSDAVNKIDGWWDQTTNWITPSSNTSTSSPRR